MLIADVSQVSQVGIQDQNIVGNGSLAAFNRIKPPGPAPTFPMLWNHDAQREMLMVVAPDSEGRVKTGRESRSFEIWDTRSHAHHNRDFRFNSQPLAVAFTETQTIGGRAWPNVKFDDRAHEIAYTLWGNTTLGLLCYWWHSSRQQAGRGSMPITAIRTMPTLDVTKLTAEQLATAENIFSDMRDSLFLPCQRSLARQHPTGAGLPRPDRNAGPAREHHPVSRPAEGKVVLGAQRPRRKTHRTGRRIGVAGSLLYWCLSSPSGDSIADTRTHTDGPAVLSRRG